ncbi:RHS repeat-associated core domain-containing protein [Frigoriglobus tundricola]|uniref:Uncharacterized protein n=1 Tax=Frigoriglobus tundricola TaxID=2774151 RepID=A0A6M5YZU0_9BACT|nr:RHS repeat-associated core domain-containing protein [Frigoriglobus tundricola]QJW98452.1 hypothetical protein FTUN_6042 [Frigoriglobus tundricola]
MTRTHRLPSAFTLFDAVLNLRDRLAGLFCARHAAPARVRLVVESMEERLVPTGIPLPNPEIFVGSGVGDAAVVKAYNAGAGTLQFSTSVSAFGSTYTGGLDVSAGDFTGSGLPDAVVSAASGTSATVTILDGTTGSAISGALGSFTAYSSITGGGVVTATGDVEGNGVTDLITAAQTTGGLEIKVFSGSDGSVLADFDVTGTAFSGAVSLAAGDLTGSGKADVVLGGSGGWVAAYDPLSGTALSSTLGGFQAFGSGYTGGVVSVAADPMAGVTNPGSTSVLAVGTGAGVTTEVKTFDASGTVLQDIQPFGSSDTNGAHVALAYVSNSSAPTTPDIVASSGSGTTDQVSVFSGTTGAQLMTPLGSYSPFGSTADGVFVAAENDFHLGPVYYYNGSTGTPSLVAGQTLSVYTIFGGNGAPPTGTLTFTLYNSSSTLLGTWAEALSPDGGPYAITTPFSVNLAAGTYTIDASYPGSPNYTTSFSGPIVSFTVSAASGIAQPMAPANPSGAGLLTSASGAWDTPADVSATGVVYGTGGVTVNRTDLSAAGFGSPWGLHWSWTNLSGYSNGINGLGSMFTETAFLEEENGTNSIALVDSAGNAHYFDWNGTSYVARYADTATLVYNSSTDQYVATDSTGQAFTFYGFSSSTASDLQGKLISAATAAGVTTSVTSRNSAGNPTQIQRSTGSGSSQLTEAYVLTYLTSGVNTGLLSGVVQETQTGSTGSWVTVRQTAYTYYTGSNAYGAAGDLETATVEDGSGNALGTSYYRYYTSGTGSTGNIAYVFDPDAYALLTAALGTGVDSLTNTQVAPYATQAFQYNSAGQVSSATIAGLGTYTYTYTTNSAASGATGPNVWTTETVETKPDGTTNTVFTNAQGGLILSVYTDASSNKWYTFDHYNSLGQLILTAAPSAVTGYSTSYLDLVNYGGGTTYLSSSAGLITDYTYASTTTATTSTAGNAAGYLQEVDIQQGTGGTIVPQETETYIENTVGSINFFNVATDTKYRNTNGTGGETTSSAYTYLSGTNQVATVTTTLPTITTAENGSNTANTTVTVYDSFGNVQWTKDANGFLNYTQTDTLTGAVVKTITDVNTSLTSTFTNLPSGWTTPTGGGLQLVTTYVVDGLGRVTKETDPNGNITYTVYLDTAHEVRTYAGWNTTTNAPTGPTTVTRDDMANGYTETLTMSAAPAVSGGVPTGTESIAKIQSLTRTYRNAAGQVTAVDTYYNLSGLTYTTGVMGTAGVNFDQTQYQYDVDGNLCRTVDQLGTITRTVYDGQGRKVSVWVGTNDTPTSGTWSPTNNTGTSNMVEVTSYQYDGGGVGDGNLTAVTQYPGGSAAAEETEYWYDWRDRKVAEKSGVQTSEGSGVNRPLTVLTYDNRNEVTEAQMYAADGLAPTIVGGVLSLPGGISSDLRAQSTISYDEQGQVYRTDTYDVNPSTGSVGSNTLYTLTWHDARGNVIETQAPGGLVTKDTVDGVGRTTAEYTTDGAGGTGYAAASSVASDTVLSQTLYTYDSNGNLVEAVSSDRFDTATGTGALGTPTTGIAARVSYMAYYFDLANRLVASVNVGTNGGTAWTRPSSVPTGSSTVLVTSTAYSTDAVQDIVLTGSPTGGTFTLTFGGQTTSAIAYNASAATVQTALQALTSVGSGNVTVSAAPSGSGWEVWFTGTLASSYQTAITGNGAGLTGGTSPAVAVTAISAGGDAGHAAIVTDPAGNVARTYTDAEGRTVRTIQDFTNGVVTGTSNATTGYTYNAVGTASVTAYQTGGGVQVTAYAYGVSATTGSTITSNDIVGITEYPDGTSGLASSAQEVTTTVNALGQALTSTDRNGNVHTYSYDVLGRQVSDAVTTLGSGVDGGVRLITTAYDGQGNAYLVTSDNATSGGSVVNQVERVYNGLGQLITEYQAQSGTVNTSSTPSVQYAYAEMPSGADQSRLTSITYPDGYVLTYNYSTGLNSTISRLSSLSDTTGTLEAYKYLGLDTVVERDHPQTNVNQTLISQTGGTGDAGDKYVGLDRFGRVVDDLWVNTSTSTTTDEFQYGYDADNNVLWRQNTVNTAFGELYTYTAENQLASFQRGTLNSTKTGLTGTASASQSFITNAVGDFTSITTNGTAQTLSANAQNEITAISGATTPTYDSNGNMTADQNGTKFVYDAWNRLVAVKNSSGTTLETFSYDGLGRRVTVTASGTTTDLFYSNQGQALEEMVSGSATARYVWSPVYVNAMVLRDNATGSPGTLNQRLWVQQDANWNVTALANGSGVVVERYVDSPYGVLTIYNAGYTSTLTSSAYGWVYGFQGMRYDATSGLNESESRFYSPTLQRWVTMDPTGFAAKDMNLYRFVTNDPTNTTDPSGLAPPSRPTGALGSQTPNWLTNTIIPPSASSNPRLDETKPTLYWTATEGWWYLAPGKLSATGHVGSVGWTDGTYNYLVPAPPVGGPAPIAPQGPPPLGVQNPPAPMVPGRPNPNQGANPFRPNPNQGANPFQGNPFGIGVPNSPPSGWYVDGVTIPVVPNPVVPPQFPNPFPSSGFTYNGIAGGVSIYPSQGLGVPGTYYGGGWSNNTMGIFLGVDPQSHGAGGMFYYNYGATPSQPFRPFRR